MSFTIFVDGSSNLPKYLLEQLDIRVLPCSYNLNGQPGVYDGDVDSFDFHGFYEMLRSGGRMETTLLNTHLFITHFSPELEAGREQDCRRQRQGPLRHGGAVSRPSRRFGFL